MVSSMAIGPAVMVGGNEIELNSKGKVEITNRKGKVITLSQDQFLKQTVKNADKIHYGEDFEYKKDNKALKIAGAAAGTAAVVTGIIYRKDIAKYMKNFSFKKVIENFKNIFGKAKDKCKNLFGKKELSYNVFNNKDIVKSGNDIVENMARIDKITKGAIHNKKQAMYERLFAETK